MSALKELELRQQCGACGQGICNNNSMTLYKVSLELHVIDYGAIRRQSGLETMMGGAAVLAQVMGPNEDMTEFMGRKELLVCQVCAAKSLVEICTDADELVNGEPD